MAYQAKMQENEASIEAFLAEIEKEQKRSDAKQLLKIFEETTGYPSKMWGTNIIGFGRYQYQYASGHKGTAPLTGFSPGKGHKMSLYILLPSSDRMENFKKRLGKFTTGKSCLYINKLADIDQEVLKEMIDLNVNYMKEMFPQNQ